MTAQCPVCKGASTIVREFPAASTRQAISKLFDRTIPDSVGIDDYKLCRCMRCTLEFANPMRPGDAGFYAWITDVEQYYPTFRVEWDKFLSQLNQSSDATNTARATLVDVGCGDGTFIKFLQGRSSLRCIGVDLSSESVESCKRSGIEAYCAPVEGGLEFVDGDVSIFTLWHVVEHVEDPKALLKSLIPRLSTHGCIYFSVPLSPTSYETTDVDALNRPPHHLTRWSIQALRRLSDELGLMATFHLPVANGSTARALLSCRMQVAPLVASKLSRNVLLCVHLLKHPLGFLGEVARQRRRPKLNGRALPDIVSVMLTKHS